MKDWQQAVVKQEMTILDAIKIIDSSSRQIALVVDDQHVLRGTVTDGDIRRAILKGISLESNIQLIMNANPTTESVNYKKTQLLDIMKHKQLRQIPIVDKDFRIVDLVTIDELIQEEVYDNWVVIMAGGLGSRLGGLTRDCPKPLLTVGGKPILETITESFKENGFRNFFFSVNYKADMIERHFGDGSNFNINIKYLREKERLGTAGALGLLPSKPDKPIIIMNGDLLTKVNFQQMLDYHVQHEAMATMCVRDYSYQVPYGVVHIENNKLKCIEEKPVQNFFVSAGVYILEPDALQYIPVDQYFDMPSLFETLLQHKQATNIFPIREYWIDIGQKDDFDRANSDYWQVFAND